MNRETMLQIAKECGFVVSNTGIGIPLDAGFDIVQPEIDALLFRFARRMQAEALREAAKFFDLLGAGEVWPEDVLRRKAEQIEKEEA